MITVNWYALNSTHNDTIMKPISDLTTVTDSYSGQISPMFTNTQISVSCYPFDI